MKIQLQMTLEKSEAITT